jgi:hypothetical protein
VFAGRAKVDRLLTFHHDPLHDDDSLDAMRARVRELWDVADDRCGVAGEGLSVEV